MKKIKGSGGWSPLSFLTAPLRWGKRTYVPEKWDDPREGDKARLQNFYLDRGYVTASVGEPRDHVRGRHDPGLFRKKPVKWAVLEIPVQEGEQYRLGEVQLRGPDRLQGGGRPRPAQGEDRRRVPRVALHQGLRQAARHLRRPGLLPVDGGHAAPAGPGAQGRGRHGEGGRGQALLRRQDPCSPATTRRATR